MAKLVVAVGQLGPIAKADSRDAVVERLLVLLETAAKRGSDICVFPEVALTTFFPRYYITDPNEIDAYFETEMPNAATLPLFDAAKRLNVGFYLGYAELDNSNGETHHFNASILVDKSGAIVGKYRKIHLPGHREYEAHRPFQNLEKRYFEPGNLGFPVFDFEGFKVGMFICNDRRWPETWRVMGLQGAQLIIGGYNTPTQNIPVPQHDHLSSFHHLLSMQAGAYQNGAWTVASAKVGVEEGVRLMGGSCIVAPTGEIAALSTNLGDDVILAECDTERCDEVRRDIFNFAAHRQPQHYSLITRPHE